MRIRRWDPTQQKEEESRRRWPSGVTRQRVRIAVRWSGRQLRWVGRHAALVVVRTTTSLLISLAVRRLFDRSDPPNPPRRRRR